MQFYLWAFGLFIFLLTAYRLPLTAYCQLISTALSKYILSFSRVNILELDTSFIGNSTVKLRLAVTPVISWIARANKASLGSPKTPNLERSSFSSTLGTRPEV